MPVNRLSRHLVVLLALTAMLSIALSALAGPDPLVGQWRYPNGSIVEFSADGVMTVKNANGTVNAKIRYWTEEGSTLVMVQEEDQTMTTGYLISAGGKRLTLDSMEEGKGKGPEVLERIK